MRQLLLRWARLLWLMVVGQKAQAVEPCKPEVPPEPPKQTRGPRRKIAQTLSTLLDDIEETFESVVRPIVRSNVHHDTRIGLRRLGPYIIPHAHTALGERKLDNPHVANASKLSSIMFVSLAGVNPDASPVEWGYPDFYFALKLQKLPAGVQKIAGVPFQFGAAFRMGGSGKLAWVNCYVVVPSDGLVKVCDERMSQQVSLPKDGSYTRFVYGVDMAQGQRQWGDDDIARKHYIASTFAELAREWRLKDGMWTVSVRHKGYRATFCVPPLETKDYFKDRDKTALTPSGKRRPIFHFVHEHQRVISEDRTTTVKEHTRGLRKFDWKSYHCAITAPKFQFVADEFRLASEEEEDPVVQKNMVAISKWGGTLADWEDNQRITH